MIASKRKFITSAENNLTFPISSVKWELENATFALDINSFTLSNLLSDSKKDFVSSLSLHNC